MDQTTRRLAQRVTETAIETLAPEAVRQTKRRLIDGIACAMGAHEEPFCAAIRQAAGRYSGQPAARIWGTGQVSSIEMAGFANGTALRYHDLNDTFLGASAGHPSDMIPALVALAEGHGATGARLLEGIVAAYELYCGLCDAAALGPRGLDQSMAAALGAAGGASRILGLDAGRTGNALALALGANVNLYNVRCGTLSDWKACAGPNAARGGIFAALLARDGVTGPTAVFDGKGGLAEVAGPLSFRDTALPRIVETRLKAYPVCYHGQSAVDAAIELSRSLHPEDIARVRVEVYETSAKMMGGDPTRWAPKTRETADHSLPFTVAVALTTGRLTSNDYLGPRLADPGLAAMMQKVAVEPAEDLTRAYPAFAGARITVTTRDGRTHAAERRQPKGHPDNPLTDDELAAKLTALWPGGERILPIVEGLDDAPGVAPLVDSLCR